MSLVLVSRQPQRISELATTYVAYGFQKIDEIEIDSFHHRIWRLWRLWLPLDTH